MIHWEGYEFHHRFTQRFGRMVELQMGKQGKTSMQRLNMVVQMIIISTKWGEELDWI